MVRKRGRGTAIVHTPNGILVVSEGGRTYHLPGGVARKGESRRRAAIRELREETGLIAIDCSYLFEYTSFSNYHKVFLIKCTGTAEPKNEIEHLAYFDGSNVDVSDATREIIERYYGIKNSKFEYVELQRSYTAEEGEKSMPKRREVCGKKEDLPFVCNYCNKTFCVDHRLPESHGCISQSIGVCPECKVRKGDGSDKVLYKCPLCEREFCAKHLDPRLAFFSASFVISEIEDTRYREELRKEMSREDSHPCIPYTKTRILEIEYNDRILAERLSNALDRSRLGRKVETEQVVASRKYRGNRKYRKYLVLIGLLFLILIIGYAIFTMIDITPPVITIISPEDKMYDTYTIDLTYILNEPTSLIGYSLNDAESIPLIGNTTLSLSAGRYNLTIYAKDIAGNIAESRVSFTVTRIFGLLEELIIFLQEDDLSNVVWTVNYTCEAFAKDFIKRAESKGYYIFSYYALMGDELGKFNDAVKSIKIVKVYSWGTETRSYVGGIGLGHAVVRTTVGAVEVIVDPQTDIILTYPDFTVLYEGEISQEW